MSEKIRCGLCGYEFEEHDAAACTSGCPIGKSCKLTRCPNCGYEFPATPRSITWLRRLFRRASDARPNGGTMCLPDLAEGDAAELVALDSTNPKRKNALAVYGVVPGCRLVLQQKHPAFVVRVGETELALEETIARELLVKKL